MMNRWMRQLSLLLPLHEMYGDPTVEAEFVGRCVELGLEGISKREMKRIWGPVVTGLPVQLLPLFFGGHFGT